MEYNTIQYNKVWTPLMRGTPSPAAAGVGPYSKRTFPPLRLQCEDRKQEALEAPQDLPQGRPGRGRHQNRPA